MIEIQGLIKKYRGQERAAVDDLNLDIGAGVFYTFLGPNGAGKTTTMRIMAGLLQPTAGSVRIAGFDVLNDPVSVKASIGYIPDHPYLYEKLSGWEFLHFIGGIYQLPEEHVTTRGHTLLEVFDLRAEADKLIDSYSHGMRQRLAFVACFLHDPKVVIIDEPWVGLDPKNIRTAINFLREQTRVGVTIFMSTHSLGIAEQVAERIGIIHKGKLLYDGDVSGLRELSGAEDLEDVFLELTEG